MKTQQVYVKTHCDTKELKKTLRLINNFSRAVEKANSLADELAKKEINVEITSSVRQSGHNAGTRFFQSLRRKFFRI